MATPAPGTNPQTGLPWGVWPQQAYDQAMGGNPGASSYLNYRAQMQSPQGLQRRLGSPNTGVPGGGWASPADAASYDSPQGNLAGALPPSRNGAPPAGGALPPQYNPGTGGVDPVPPNPQSNPGGPGGALPPGQQPASNPGGNPYLQNLNLPSRNSYRAQAPYNAGTQGPSSYQAGVQIPNEPIASEFESNYGFGADQGAALNSQFGNDYGYYGGLEDYYRQGADQSYGQLNETPGYTPEEYNNITREGQFNAGVAGPQDYSNLNMTQGEQAGVKGDPNSLYNYFQPGELDNMRSINSQARANSLGERNTAVGQMQGANEGEDQQYAEALDPSKLSQSSDYKAALSGALDKGALNLSDKFASDYRLTPQQQQDMVDQAGTSVGYGTQAQKEEIQRRAAASGNSSPLAIAAAEDRANRTGLTAGADAMTNARIAASKEAAGREKDIESMRLGAAQNYAGLDVSALSDEEKQRVAAEQYQAGQRINTANQTGANKRSTAQYGANAGTAAENAYASGAGGTERYITDTGTGIAGNVDTRNTNAANTLYNNRLNVGQYGINSKFGQNFQTQGQLSSTNQAAANARVAGQNNYRNYLTTQAGQTLGARQNAGQQQLSTFGTAGQLRNGSTSAYGQWWNGRRAQDTAAAQIPTNVDKGVAAATGFLRAI